MGVYFLFGKYTSDSVREITSSRTQQAVGIIEEHNGQIRAMYGLLGVYDLVFIVNLPSNTEAFNTSVQLSKETEISFTTSPAISVEEFDSLLSDDIDLLGLDDNELEDPPGV